MPPPLRRPLELVIRSEGRKVARVLVRPGTYTLGHERSNDISIDDPSVSSKHAVLSVVSEDEIYVQDVGSANGSFVDGQPCEQPIRVGLTSLVQLGQSSAVLQRGGLPAAVFLHVPEEFLGMRQYEWGDPLVRGGISTIHEGRDLTLRRPVAMRVMQPASQLSATTVLRFVREAQIMAQLQHPHIPPVHELEMSEEGQLYYTTRAVEGEQVSDIIDRLRANDAATAARWPLAALLAVFQKTADAVAYAHSRGVVHCALKPDNIVVGDYGEVLVMGWTFTRLFTEGMDPVRGDRQVQAVGEPAYSAVSAYTAPEQAVAPGVFDERADVYALGGILYAMLQHTPPFPEPNERPLEERILSGEINPPKAENVRGGLAEIVMRALNTSPARRPRSVVEFQAWVAAWQAGGVSEVKKKGFFGG